MDTTVTQAGDPYQIDLNWSDMTSQTPALSEYRIDRRTPGLEWVEVAQLPLAGGPSWTDPDVFANTSYLYRVRGWRTADSRISTS